MSVSGKSNMATAPPSGYDKGPAAPYPYPVPMAIPVAVPVAQAAPNVLGILSVTRGAVIKQKWRDGAVLAEALDAAYTSTNKYTVAAMPAEVKTKSDPDDITGWAPTERDIEALVPYMKVRGLWLLLDHFCGSGRELAQELI